MLLVVVVVEEEEEEGIVVVVVDKVVEGLDVVMDCVGTPGRDKKKG